MKGWAQWECPGLLAPGYVEAHKEGAAMGRQECLQVARSLPIVGGSRGRRGWRAAGWQQSTR